MDIYHSDKYLDYVRCNISDHTDGTVMQRATNNVDACTHCAYLFLFECPQLYHLIKNSSITEVVNIACEFVLLSRRKCL